MSHQLLLPLPPVLRPVCAPMLAAPSNADALAWLRETPAWPSGRLALWGGGGVGKTHALHLWAGREGAEVLDGAALRAAPLVHGPLAVDDADRAPDEAALLHLLNRAAEEGHPLLLAGRLPPARWPVALPDLRSRLRATATAGFGAPEDALLRGLLARLLRERQLVVPEAVQDWLLAHLPRTAEAVRQAAGRLDDLVRGYGGSTRFAAAEVADALRDEWQEGADDSAGTTYAFGRDLLQPGARPRAEGTAREAAIP